MKRYRVRFVNSEGQKDTLGIMAQSMTEALAKVIQNKDVQEVILIERSAIYT
jgi:hypothetical protein